MTRPHEDIQHHTAVDHRPGGPPVAFAKNAWCAIDVVHVKSDRAGAGISAYETLIEEARKSPTKAGSAVILRAGDDRGVLALVEVGGHDAFKHLQSAWDNHHLLAEHRAVAESSKLALYQVIAITGDCALDPQSKDAYAVEPFPSGATAGRETSRGPSGRARFPRHGAHWNRRRDQIVCDLPLRTRRTNRGAALGGAARLSGQDVRVA